MDDPNPDPAPSEQRRHVLWLELMNSSWDDMRQELVHDVEVRGSVTAWVAGRGLVSWLVGCVCDMVVRRSDLI